MIFHATKLPSAYVLEPERHGDERGFFARIWCAREFEAHGLCAHFVQGSVSFNPKRGTLRGLHYQAAPHSEVKLVRCTRGAIYDVVLDLRPDSPAFLQHVAVVLSADSRTTVYVPEGCAHGFQTLADDTEVAYDMSTFYVPDAARGVRWDDPAFAVPWPPDDRLIAPRDRQYPDFRVTR